MRIFQKPLPKPTPATASPHKVAARSSARPSTGMFTSSCRVLPCVAVCCRVLPCAAVCCRVLPCVAVCCRVLQCAAVCCSVLRVLPCVAVCCRVLNCVAVCAARSVLQCVAVCCSVLQCISALQCVRSPEHRCSWFVARHIVFICGVYALQHTATHCNTLQHTATHCSETYRIYM